MLKKLLILLLPVLLSACAGQTSRTLPPVIDGSSGSVESGPDAPVPVPAPVPQARDSGGQAVVALLDQADSQTRGGDRDAAAASLERALRIEPRNAQLWQRLASLRLQQGEPAQAEQLALKSNALARTDNRLKAENWRIVAQARWAMKDDAGARRAESKAREFDRR